MPFLLKLEQPVVELENVPRPGLTGVVVTVPASDLQSGNCNASLQSVQSAELELYCQLSKESIGSYSAQELWSQLERVQTQLPFAKVVLPLFPQSLELIQKSAQYAWNWQLSGVTTIAHIALALNCGAGAVWIEVGVLDGLHEQDGDELCSQARSYVDEHFVTGHKPLIVASDVRDRDHIERTVLYGCDRVVVSAELWNVLAR